MTSEPQPSTPTHSAHGQERRATERTTRQAGASFRRRDHFFGTSSSTNAALVRGSGRVIEMLLLAGALAEAPPLRVRVVGEQAEPASDWLVGRLLEEGFAVTAGDDAEIDLTIAQADRSWEISAQGETSERFAVPIDHDEGVARLELLHVAVGALESVQPRAVAGRKDDRAFAIELADTFASEARAAVLAELARAVLDGGGSLAPHRGSAAFVLCASLGDRAVAVEVRDATEPCPIAAEVEPIAVRERARNVVAAVLVDDAEQTVAAATPAQDWERAPLGPRAPERSEPRRRWSNGALMVRGGASTGVVARVRAPDAVVAASMFVGTEPGVALWLDMQVWSSTTRRDRLFVLELLPAVGVRVRAWTRGRVSLDLGALVGVQVHGYRFKGDAGIGSDWSVEGAAGFAVRLWREHELQLMMRAGRIGRERWHKIDGVTAWHREPWRVAATVGLTFGRRLKR
jgi:hypothetical protein